MASRVARARSAASRRWREAREKHRWIGHVVDAWQRFQANRGGQYAAAITYFSFLALIPLILLAVSVAGFVLANDPARLHELFDHISSSLPGAFGTTVKNAVNSAIDNRTSVGMVALVGILLTGLGWIANLRSASNAVWGLTPPKRKFVVVKLRDLVVLVGLGIGALLSVGLTAGGTALAGKALDAVGIDFAGAGTLTAIIGIGLAVAGDTLIFAWLLVRLPKASAPRGTVLKGALLAAVGFEVLKLVGTVYIARVNTSPTAGIFGSVIGILVWMYLVARWVLFCVAWTATGVPATPREVYAAAALAGAVEATDVPPNVAISPRAVAASLLGVGVAIGAATVGWLTARRRG
jgi:membrane protein